MDRKGYVSHILSSAAGLTLLYVIYLVFAEVVLGDSGAGFGLVVVPQVFVIAAAVAASVSVLMNHMPASMKKYHIRAIYAVPAVLFVAFAIYSRIP